MAFKKKSKNLESHMLQHFTTYEKTGTEILQERTLVHVVNLKNISLSETLMCVFFWRARGHKIRYG